MNGNSVISAFITNAGKYAEGELIGQWVDFPTENKVVQRTLKEIGVDGVNYEEYFMSDYNTEVEELIDYLPEYCDIDELNYLAAEIGNLGNYELEIYEAALELGYNLQSVKDLINLTDNTDCYGYLKNVTDDNDLGYYWIEESGCYDTKAMGNLSNYIDYEGFGRDIRYDESGCYTNKGYVYNNGDTFKEFYDGKEVPEEYRVFEYPANVKVKTLKRRDSRNMER